MDPGANVRPEVFPSIKTLSSARALAGARCSRKAGSSSNAPVFFVDPADPRAICRESRRKEMSARTIRS